ncbi:MAG: hypothetical protein HY360_12010 [Verrucomicrobia bacterium]|nr:hypothetical protein [Verrucomicrobiota bacterium]
MKEPHDTARFPRVWNRRVDPARGHGFATRRTKPLTLAELEGNYVTGGLRRIPVTKGRISLKRLRRLLDRWHHPRLKPGESSRDGRCHNFGRALWLNLSFLNASNWREAMQEIRKRGLYVYDCWGNVPGLKDWRQGGGELVVPDEVQAGMQQALGRYFIGWDNGENDGRWFWQALRIWPAPTNRRAAYEYFMGWFAPHFRCLQNDAVSLCGLTFPHYFARIDGTRMIGAEFGQALPSVPMWAAWVRGAARQYEMLWMAGISVFNLFGYKTFEADAIQGDSHGKSWIGRGNPQMQTGPDRGHSLSLLKRMWHVLFMYGVNVESFEMSRFFREHHLSPLGKLQLDATAFCVKNEKRRGVLYSPVAMLLDRYSGWAPPRHHYSDSFYTVGGGLPYEQGDHQLDLFFREFYPGYQDCPYFRGDRGFLTATPHGDIADVVLSDVHPEILSRYQTALVLGEITVMGALFRKLRDFVRQGGLVIWSLPQLGADGLCLSGIARVQKTFRGHATRDRRTGRAWREKPYIFNAVDLAGASVWLESDSGHPLVVAKKAGRGRVITMLAPYGLTRRMPEPHPVIGCDPERDVTTLSFLDKPLGSPYRLLEGIKAVVFEILDRCNVVEVMAGLDPPEAEPIPRRAVAVQYLTNLTDRPDRLIVTVINVEPVVAYLRLRAKRARIVRALDLLRGGRRVTVNDGMVSLTLHPADAAEFNIHILELQLDRPVVHFSKNSFS